MAQPRDSNSGHAVRGCADASKYFQPRIDVGLPFSPEVT
jgi:hypothetical protein